MKTSERNHYKRQQGICHTTEQWRTSSSAWRILSLCAWLWGLWLVVSLSSVDVMAAGSGLDYKVAITGISDGKLRTALEEISQTVLLRKKRPAGSLALLRRRVKRDMPRLLKLLKAEGYYGAQVKADIDDKVTPVHVTFQVNPGPPYLIDSVQVKTIGKDTRHRAKLPEPNELGLRLGMQAKARVILDGQEKLIRLLRKQGFPFSQIAKRKVMVHHPEHAVAVVFLVDTGPLSRFGPTKITGLKSVDEEFVRSKVSWQEGDLFNADLCDQVKKRLTDTGLFATVRVKTGETLEDDGFLLITIEVVERRHRTKSIGVSYSTDEGPGATISWEHRNLLGRGERLRLKAIGSQITLAAEAEFRKPKFLRNDQLLRLDLRAAEDRPDAFTSRSLYSSFLVDRTLAKGVIIGSGLAFKASHVEQTGEEDNYGLISVPVHLDRDTSDSFLDSTRGGRLTLEFAPFIDTFGSDLSFLKGQGSYSRYVRLSTSPCLVLAGRAALGCMTGAARDAIPADERFYAGGGGSIRGYPFQSVGPLDGTDPLGGRSLLVMSAELRLKLSAHIGLVAFIDGGSAFESSTPSLNEDLRWGAGLGFRYFTGIGPVRLDIGIPLNRRKDIDDSFQVYMSLGQAF